MPERDLGEMVELPDGTRLYFTADSHAYYRCKEDGSRGKRLTGVTTVIKPVDFSPDALMKWSAKLNGEGIAQLAALGLSLDEADDIRGELGWLESADAIWAALEESELTYIHIRDKAAKRGTAVHELALRALAEGRKVPSLSRFTDEERGYAQAVMRFWADTEPEPLNVEQIVAHEDLGVAGRFDLRARLSDRPGVGMIDAKTSRYVFEGAHVQVAGYSYLASECGIGDSQWAAILHLHEDGSYELIDCEATAEDFLASVDLYRRAGRIKGAARKAYKARVPA